MKNTILISLILILSINSNLLSQELVDISNTGTCENALDITRFRRFGPTTPPEKQGSVDPNSFELTKHPTWYKFTAQKSGLLLLDIIPSNPKDNYDFLIYKATPDFCAKFQANQAKAMRANFDPPFSENKGYTGLSFSGEQQGFAKAINVKEGELYYLALNNVYEKGKGHSVVLYYLKTFKVNGSISNIKNEHTVDAKITWRNLRNEDITVKTQSEKKGTFSIMAVASTDPNVFPQYELSVYADKFFPEYKIFTTEEINQSEITPVEINLNKIKKGYNNESLGVVYFEPNDLVTTKDSEYAKKRLLRLMQLNNRVEIILEGHTNGIYPSTEVDFELSLKRAEAVRDFLTGNGIEAERIQVKGLGSTKEIYAAPENEEQEGANRRVEVNFVKF